MCSEDQVASIADRMVTEVSTSSDGSLSFEDFERATKYELSTGLELILGSKVLCIFCFEICTPEGRG